jgi:hypothetical protein
MSWAAYFALKERWRVSLQALLYRARTLGMLSPDAYRRAQIHLSRQGWHGNEPVEIGPPEEPALVERALALIDSELGMDAQDVGDACALPGPVFTSVVGDAVAASPPRPRVEVL